MQINANKVVSINYTLTNNEGTILDTSDGRGPLNFIQGIGMLIPGMEEGLEGKTAGEKLNLKIAPEKAYGIKRPELVQRVPLSAFGDQMVSPGMQFEAGSEDNQFLVTITSVEETEAVVDANHPLAGVELNFDVEILSVREATPEELDHGHVH
jgi:FKBP-type peptidyl-prolyl cis-trans isomerase SlyD